MKEGSVDTGKIYVEEVIVGKLEGEVVTWYLSHFPLL